MHFKWNYEEPTPEQQKSAKELADKLSMSPILAQLLIHRGITTESAAKRFFRPQLSDLINPFLMKDVMEAVGIKDVRAKCLRSNNPQNVVSAAFQGLKSLRSPEEVARIRGKSVEEIVG